jgi:hypothetical protein
MLKIRPRTQTKTSSQPGPGWRGRRSECDLLNRLNRLIGAVRAGGSRVLVVCGEPGAGKSALLESVLAGPLDARVRDRIVAGIRGNPLELPRGLAPAELAGGFGLPGAAALSGRVGKAFRRRVDALPGPAEDVAGESWSARPAS